MLRFCCLKVEPKAVLNEVRKRLLNMMNCMVCYYVSQNERSGRNSQGVFGKWIYEIRWIRVAIHCAFDTVGNRRRRNFLQWRFERWQNLGDSMFFERCCGSTEICAWSFVFVQIWESRSIERWGWPDRWPWKASDRKEGKLNKLGIEPRATNCHTIKTSERNSHSLVPGFLLQRKVFSFLCCPWDGLLLDRTQSWNHLALVVWITTLWMIK